MLDPVSEFITLDLHLRCLGPPTKNKGHRDHIAIFCVTLRRLQGEVSFSLPV
jgi:hypothetical protein